MPTQIQLRRGTASGWSSENPILAQGEIGIETDDLTSTSIPYKIGDGVNTWDNLPYQSTDLNGYLSKSTYDPQNIEGDTFDRANHTGLQDASTISDFDTEVANNTAVAANTAKNSYPSADATKLAGIETGAEVNPTDNEIKTSYESNANTNAFTDDEKTLLGNQSNTNTGDETTSTIQTKRPLKTVNNTSLEGTGNIEIVGGVESVNGESGDVELSAEDIDTTATSGKTIKAEIDENPTATQLGRIKAVFDSNSGEFVMSIDGTDIT